MSGLLELVPDPGRAADIYLVSNAQDMLNVLWPHTPTLVVRWRYEIYGFVADKS